MRSSQLSVNIHGLLPLRRSFAQKLTLQVLTGFCFLCGVDVSANKKAFGQRLVTIFMRMILVSMIVLSFIAHVVQTCADFPKTPSASDLFDALYGFNIFGMIVEATRQLWKNQSFLRHLLTDDRSNSLFSLRITVVFLLGMSLIIGNFYYQFYREPKPAALWEQLENPLCRRILLVVEVLHPLIWQPHIFSMLLYIHAERVIEIRLQQLANSISMLSLKKIVETKSQIRELLAGINQTFGRLLLYMYSSIFAIIYTTIVSLLLNCGSQNLYFKSMPPVLKILMLGHMASRGSEIINISKRTEFDILHLNMKNSEKDEADIFFRIMAYDVERDALTVSSCFANKRSTLIAFSGTVVTCLTILLQFDYRIMAKFDKDKLAYNGTWTK